MAYHGILVQDAVMASNIDTLNRNAKCAADLDNGNIFYLASKTGTTGEGEVWSATQPATASGLKLSLHLLGTTYISLADGTIGTQRKTAYQFEVVDNTTGLWMAYAPEVVVTDGKYRGINPDPRDFYTAANTIFDAFKPQVGDIVTLTDEAISGTKSTNTYIVAANGSYQLAWAATANS